MYFSHLEKNVENFSFDDINILDEFLEKITMNDMRNNINPNIKQSMRKPSVKKF